ncbi:MAG: cupredoxin domain-containing protein [Candidatus Colwellbacteria bacterium]|nr:cupredoxin domain-containing protein [Candidatus Colwellbacteria bacterium]
MSKTIIIGLIVMGVALTLGGLVFFRSGGLKFSSTMNEVNKVASTDGDSEVTVFIRNGSFEPSDIRIAQGGRVIWVNDDVVVHTVTSDKGLFDSREINGSGSFEKVFDKKGDYEYHCKLHQSMKGKVIVK